MLASAGSSEARNWRRSANPLLRASARDDEDPIKVETKLPSGITIYGNDEVTKKLAAVINEIPEI